MVNSTQCMQLVEYVIRPTLLSLSTWRSWIYSEAAENLLLWTALVESELKYLHQLKGGPAIGYWQMEHATHEDIWRWLQRHTDLVGILPYMTPESGEMHGNLYYACAMARLKYAMVPEPLPGYMDIEAMARYWGKYYNTLNRVEDQDRFIELAKDSLT